MHLWDSLLLCGSGMVICIGVAIVIELRDTLLSHDFEQCILLFTDTPDVDIQRIVDTARTVFDQTMPSMYARTHSRPDNEPPLEGYTVPSIDMLKRQLVPFISVQDFMELYPENDEIGRLSDSNRVASRQGIRRKKARVLAVDIREASDFAIGHLEVDTVSLPFDEVFDGHTLGQEHLTLLETWRGKHIVIINARSSTSPKFAEALLKLKFPRVVILTGGASALRVQGLLTRTGAVGDE